MAHFSSSWVRLSHFFIRHYVTGCRIFRSKHFNAGITVLMTASSCIILGINNARMCSFTENRDSDMHLFDVPIGTSAFKITHVIRTVQCYSVQFPFLDEMRYKRRTVLIRGSQREQPSKVETTRGTEAICLTGLQSTNNFFPF